MPGQAVDRRPEAVREQLVPAVRLQPPHTPARRRAAERQASLCYQASEHPGGSRSTFVAMLDIRRIRMLHAVARLGSCGAAAKALSFTPSAVWQQMAALEREAGTQLFDRGARRPADAER